MGHTMKTWHDSEEREHEVCRTAPKMYHNVVNCRRLSLWQKGARDKSMSTTSHTYVCPFLGLDSAFSAVHSSLTRARGLSPKGNLVVAPAPAEMVLFNACQIGGN